jgi:hypothetical protein
MLLSLFGRRYFSIIDFEFSELIFNKKNKNTIFQNNISEVSYDMLIKPFSNKDNEELIPVDDEKDLITKIGLLELRATYLLENNKDNIKILSLVKLVYHRLIYFFNSIHQPYYAGLINQSYLMILRSNTNITNAGPLETMRLFIGVGVSNTSLRSEEIFLNKLFYNTRYKRYNIYKSIFLKNALDYSEISNSFKLNKLDREFYNFVLNKKIILVGPASSYEIDKEIMSSIDIIVLLNHTGFSKTYNFMQKYVDRIPIISYYSGDRLRMITSEDIDEINQNIGYSVWSERGLVSKFPNIDLNLEKKARVFRNHDQLIEFGRWNFAIYVLIDLLLFQPQSIYITGLNLFLEKKGTLYSNYFNANNYENKHSIYTHNQYEQFCMLKELYINNAISPDKYLRNILKLTPLDYIQKLIDSLV